MTGDELLLSDIKSLLIELVRNSALGGAGSGFGSSQPQQRVNTQDIDPWPRYESEVSRRAALSKEETQLEKYQESRLDPTRHNTVPVTRSQAWENLGGAIGAGTGISLFSDIARASKAGRQTGEAIGDIFSFGKRTSPKQPSEPRVRDLDTNPVKPSGGPIFWSNDDNKQRTTVGDWGTTTNPQPTTATIDFNRQIQSSEEGLRGTRSRPFESSESSHSTTLTPTERQLVETQESASTGGGASSESLIQAIETLTGAVNDLRDTFLGSSSSSGGNKEQSIGVQDNGSGWPMTAPSVGNPRGQAREASYEDWKKMLSK